MNGPVSLKDVGHRFPGSPWLFRQISFTFTQGTTYALTGPSGSGKSTLLSLLAGWVKPAEGEVLRAEQLAVRWVFQNPHGVSARSALDHVVLPILARGVRRKVAEEEARGYLQQVSLEHVADRPFSQLSGGEGQRLMLARGISSKPDVLLVDEPTAQLDFATGDTVNRAISNLTAGSTTIVVATHDSRTIDACGAHLALDTYAPVSSIEQSLSYIEAER